MRSTFRALAVLPALQLACGAPAPERAETTTRGGEQQVDVAADPLRSSAERIARFLSGGIDSTALPLADSVDLYIAPEGGGGQVRRSRAELLRRDNWYVRSGGVTHSFVPDARFEKMESFVGKHVNCRPADLRTRSPELAARPHVGVLLSHPNGGCMATWNATFVFDTSGPTPLLIAALYDQWEW